MDSQNQAKAEALYKKISQSPTYSEDTANEYQKCLELNPKHLQALWKLGCIYDGDNDYEGNGSYWFEFKCKNEVKSIDCFTRIIQIDPKFSQAYSRLGKIYFDSNKEKALQYSLQSYKLNPQDYTAIRRIGYIYLQLSRYQQAIGNFTKCIQHDQKDISAHQGLAKIYESQSNFKEALQCLKRCTEINCKNADTYAQFGHIYHAMGDHKRAIHSYMKCKQLKYDHKEALKYLDKHLKAYLNESLTKGAKH